MTLALLIIDMQQDWFADYPDPARAAEVQQRLVPAINRLLDAARRAKSPVIWVVVEYAADGSDWTLRMRDLDQPAAIAGTHGAQLIDGLAVAPEDHRVVKSRYSAFFQTDLDAILAAHEPDALAICGIDTHACVRATIVDAFMRDYRIFLPLECVDSYEPAQHAATLSYIGNRLVKTLSVDDLIARMERDELAFRFA